MGRAVSAGGGQKVGRLAGRKTVGKREGERDCCSDLEGRELQRKRERE